MEALSLSMAAKPLISEAEITTKEKEVQDYPFKLGNTKWCELYAVEMREAHLIVTMANRQ
jgi:hypothetical protein